MAVNGIIMGRWVVSLSDVARCLVAAVIATSVLTTSVSHAAPPAGQRRTFATPEEAVRALAAAVNGGEAWPFPVPLVKEGSRWRFDTAAGKEEVLDRRIGRNELAVIAVCRSYLSAQHRYAQDGHDGKRPGLYAMTFHSELGKQNGLYWAVAHGQKRSPLGDLVAQAAEEGRPVAEGGAAPLPLYGYYFKILTAQGPHAPGGAKPYVVDGAMSAGFALVAWPAQYDASGVMTFVVNQDGIVRQKDLGPRTDTIASAMTHYDPDASWAAVH